MILYIIVGYLQWDANLQWDVFIYFPKPIGPYIYQAQCPNSYMPTYCCQLNDSDSNECDDGSNMCNENANCVDLVGSYKCTCMEGYRGTGFECEGTCNVTHSR